MQNTTNNFNTHIENIKLARKQSKAILETFIPCFDSAEASISLIWEAIFDYLVINENKHTLSEFNTLSGIIQKLMSSYSTLKSLEIKSSEHHMKKEEFDIKIKEIKNNLLPTLKKGEFLPSEILLEVENQLNLL